MVPMRAAIKSASRMSFPIFNGFPPKNVCWDIRQRPTPDPPSRRLNANRNRSYSQHKSLILLTSDVAAVSGYIVGVTVNC